VYLLCSKKSAQVSTFLNSLKNINLKQASQFSKLFLDLQVLRYCLENIGLKIRHHNEKVNKD
jgi:hypothetical protein